MKLKNWQARLLVWGYNALVVVLLLGLTALVILALWGIAMKPVR
jgi:hypothetical protein